MDFRKLTARPTSFSGAFMKAAYVYKAVRGIVLLWNIFLVDNHNTGEDKGL